MERQRKRDAQNQLMSQERRHRLTLSGMRAGGLSAAERNNHGNSYMRQGNSHVSQRLSVVLCLCLLFVCRLELSLSENRD